MTTKKPRHQRSLIELGIDLTPIPEPPPPPPKRSVGRQSRLGVQSFLYRLFEYNELVPPEARLTDYAIMQKLKAEFPGRRSLNNLKLAKRRYQYNRGRLLKHQQPPLRCSFRYNNEGQAVEPQTGRVYSPEELAEVCRKFNIADPRYLPTPDHTSEDVTHGRQALEEE